MQGTTVKEAAWMFFKDKYICQMKERDVVDICYYFW